MEPSRLQDRFMPSTTHAEEAEEMREGFTGKETWEASLKRREGDLVGAVPCAPVQVGV